MFKLSRKHLRREKRKVGVYMKQFFFCKSLKVVLLEIKLYKNTIEK